MEQHVDGHCGIPCGLCVMITVALMEGQLMRMNGKVDKIAFDDFSDMATHGEVLCFLY